MNETRVGMKLFRTFHMYFNTYDINLCVEFVRKLAIVTKITIYLNIFVIDMMRISMKFFESKP